MSAHKSRVDVLVIENDLSAPVARLGEWLRDADAALDVRSGAAGDPIPDSLSGYDALVVMGGAPNVFDDARAPWLPRVRRLLADAVREGVPTLGVCLGGQLLAAATGGLVEPAEVPEYGAQLIAKRTVSATDPLFGELPITPDVLQWHADAVTRLPAGAVLLASSPMCEVQAFRVGRLAWGLQFHIETTPEIVARWAVEDAYALSDYDLDTILERAQAAHDDFEAAWRPFAAAFVAVVRDPSSAEAPGMAPLAHASRRLPLAQASRTLPLTEDSRTLPLAGDETGLANPITDPAEIRAALAAEMQAARGAH